MLKKGLLLVVALLVVGFVITPLVQAQTAAQQQELEQIARRSMNGLSAQDRQRVIAIMTDVYVAQGMPRQQAASLAEMAAGSMFSGDVGEMSPEQRRQFAEQEERIQYFEGADERSRQAQEQERRDAEQRRLYPGENRGWPTAQLQERGLGNLRQPAGTNTSYNGDAGWVSEIFLTNANNTAFQNLRQQMETIAGNSITVSGNKFSVMYRSSGSGRMSSQSYMDVELEGTQIKITLRESAA